jgi:4-nitrophenyl phosphatase
MTDGYNWLRDIDAFLIDLDGTLYRGQHAIPFAKEFIEWLDTHHKKYLFVTNNSAPRAETVAERLRGMGIPAETGHVFTSSQATAMYIKEQNHNETPSYYAIGEEGLITALEEAGCRQDAEQPHYVVVGIDRGLTYNKLMTASLAIQKGAVYLATNADKRVPTEKGLVPGAGSINQALATASGVEPVWIGKPEARMVEYSLQSLGVVAERTVMVGDNLETDILAGANGGVKTILVLTGYSQRDDAANSQAKPDLIVETLQELMQLVEKLK